MLNKYIFVCLVFPLVENAACPDPPKTKVADISLDYYFGLDDTLRSARYMENCNPRGVHDSCQKLCGPNHACLMGKCFCVDVKPQIKEEVLEELLRRTSKTARGRQRATSVEDSSLESESRENNPSYIQLDPMGMRPTLRHHIAHFCPNLAIARKCIRECLELGKPAFCGKDHVCYCGHKYGTPKDDVVASEEYYTQFQDLYERYFGPKYVATTTTTTQKPKNLTDFSKVYNAGGFNSSKTSESKAPDKESSLESNSSNSNSKSKENSSKSAEKNNTSEESKSEEKSSKSDDKSKTSEESKSEEKTNTSKSKDSKSEEKENKSRSEENKKESEENKKESEENKKGSEESNALRRV